MLTGQQISNGDSGSSRTPSMGYASLPVSPASLPDDQENSPEPPAIEVKMRPKATKPPSGNKRHILSVTFSIVLELDEISTENDFSTQSRVIQSGKASPLPPLRLQ